MQKNDILDILIKQTREVIPELNGHRFKPSDTLKDLGANSIDRAEIITMTIESLSLTIPLTDMAGAGNIGELAGILHEKTKSA